MRLKERHLYHLTLETGHVRRSPRSEVDEAILTMVGQMIAEALQGMAPEPVPGVTLHAEARNEALRVLVQAGDDVLVAFGVAPTPEAGRMAWRDIRRLAGFAIRKKPPEAPWCAVSLQPGILWHSDHVHLLGDLERCIAWAWIDGKVGSGW